MTRDAAAAEARALWARSLDLAVPEDERQAAADRVVVLAQEHNLLGGEVWGRSSGQVPADGQ